MPFTGKVIPLFVFFNGSENQLVPPSWDRVAVKYSYDDGIGWTDPQPVQFTNMPANFQRPFDPTFGKLGNDSLRIYFFQVMACQLMEIPSLTLILQSVRMV